MGPADEEAAVVVRTTHHPLPPGGRPMGGDVVLVGEIIDSFEGERADERFDAAVVALRPAAVPHLEGVEQEHHLLDMARGQLLVLGVERVGDEVGDPLLVQVGGQLVDVFPDPHQVPEDALGDVEDDHVDLAVVLREVAGQLGAQEGPRQVGDLQGAADGVVVGDGDVVHPEFLGAVVDEAGGGVALRAVELAQRPVGRLVGVGGVDVQVGLVYPFHAARYNKATLQESYGDVIFL